MTLETRNRIRWAIATFVCVGTILMCADFEFSAKVTWLAAALWCPVERPWLHVANRWRGEWRRTKRDAQSAIQLLQKRA